MGIWLQPGDVPGIDEPAITELIAELEAYLSLHFPCLLTLTPDKQALLKALLIPIVRRWNTTDTGSSGQVVAGPFQMRADSDNQGHSIEPEESTSFRLHTSKDWFYPDFLCKLGDGRVLAVEYKGKHLWADAEDKRVIGAVWAGRSKGRCLFVMPTDGDFSILLRTVKSS